MRRITYLLLLALLLQSAMALENNPYPEPSDDNPATDDSRPMLGVNMSPVPVPIQRKNNISHDQGVYVRHIYEGTTATEIGIERGDVIVDINGSGIDSMSSVRDSIFSHRVGDDISVTVLRNGEQVQLGGTLGGWPESIPLNKINAQAEARYRQMQARRLARESEMLDKRIAEAKQRNQGGLGSDGNSRLADWDRARSSNELDKLFAQDFGEDAVGVLPGIEISPFAAMLQWQFSFALDCPDPQVDEAVAVIADEPGDHSWTDLSHEELIALAPDFDLAYAFRISTESL